MYPIISIANKENKVGICVFNGNNYRYYHCFYDDIALFKTFEIIQNLNPREIISSVSGIFKHTLKHKYRSIHFISVKGEHDKFNNLESIEYISIKLLSVFLNHKPLIQVENNNIVGYSGKYSILPEKHSNFYINEDIIENINKMSTLDLLLKNVSTKIGRLTVFHWIYNPCVTEADLKERRSFVDYISSNIPRMKKLLKECRFPSLEKPICFYKMRKTLKTSLLLHKMVQDKISVLKNRKQLLKLYKMLQIFDKNGISDQKDSLLDEYRNRFRNLSIVLERISKKLANQYNISLSTVYFPNIGFCIESAIPFDNPVFKINDKFYSKNDEMCELDRRYGDPYCDINKREAFITSRIMKRLLSIDFSELWNIIGRLDASISLYLSSNGHFADIKQNCDSMELSSDYFYKKSIFTYQININKIIETIIINQIGGLVSDKIKQLPIFKNMAVKRELKSIDNEYNSTFQNEIIRLGKIFRNVTDRSICLIEGIGESTTPMEGISLLAAFTECLISDILIISTKFDEEELKNYIDSRIIRISDKNNDEKISDLFVNYLKIFTK